ncbi:HvfC/BufC family peptide modification chaperone [Candidatus Berkiella aquae]|uniref:DNA-binding domain-containing protein n=1 Tax=Candidatus Berkiella aquae TaxID=295108 RepID=A0A0Q9YNI7_9GAMM|nr:putative DNA-binding domain-containing protein [Candidatus Berkiella aquae]MCS5712527.1 DNA-binding domain-containing protein [Candidatus Berkiella aquae]
MLIIDLKQLQQHFLHELDCPGKEADWIKQTRLSPDEQLAIYRGSVLGGLYQILQAIFPVCIRLVGEPYFKQLTRVFIAQTPHQHPDITHYGQSFAVFIQESLSQHQLCYLADVVALEWACHLALNGAGMPELDKELLAKVPPTQHPDLTFALAEYSTLLYSPYPILRIWQNNQDDKRGDELISLDEGKTYLLVHRRAQRLCLSPLTEEAFKMLTYFAAGESFITVCQKCCDEYPNVDIPPIFAECIQREYLVSFAVDNKGCALK